MKIFILLSIVLVGCSQDQSNMQKSSGNIVCVDNVEYISYRDLGITPHLKTDGSLYLCNKIITVE